MIYILGAREFAQKCSKSLTCKTRRSFETSTQKCQSNDTRTPMMNLMSTDAVLLLSVISDLMSIECMHATEHYDWYSEVRW